MTNISFSSFELNNYKSIKKSPRMSIPGITVLLGPNSSGKSNILESILLLKQSFEHEGLNLRFNGKIVKLGEYRDVVHKHDVSSNIVYKFNFEKSERETSDDYECPICNSGYTYEGYYTNHLENEHPNFWSKYNNQISVFEEFLEKESFIKISFGFDEKTKSNTLNEIELGYPPSTGGLFISSMKVIENKDEYTLAVNDICGNEILNLSENKATIQEELPDQMSGLTNIFTTLAVSPAPAPDPIYRYARPGLPRLESDDEYPSIYEEKEIIAEIIQNDIEEFDGNDVIEEYEEYIDSLDRNERLAVGLLSRVANSARNHSGNFIIYSLLDNITHVGPLRRNPQRIYFGSGGSPGQADSSDQDIEELIFRDKQIKESNLIERTNNWLAETGFDCEIEIMDVGVGDLYQLQVMEDGLSVNLADTGFGLSQVLPIIVKSINMEYEKKRSADDVRRSIPAFRRARPDIYTSLIQQPEIHLNPKIEAKIGDFFINLMESDINMIIETHSEHLLNRLQRRTADGTIENSEDISIYFFSKEDNVSDITEISISSDGVFDYWPEGFFQEDFDEAMSILKESMGE